MRVNFDIYLVGVGGQGVLTIAEIISEAAFHKDIPANYFPTEGMAQRGGFVKAQVRLGRKLVGPNIPEKGADLAIAMEISEALKAVRFVRPGGDFILWGHIWAPTAVMPGKAKYPPLDQVKEQIKLAQANLYFIDPEYLPLFEGELAPYNLYVLGAAVARTGLRNLIDPATVLKVIQTRWPKNAGRNAFAFQSGLESEVEVVNWKAQIIA
ncbi:MAG: 2-oxoacid:acceptor oxidoreductase family protein [Planctomycetes bacterium]|nr:2-oxoacid:acceptor oxidoreductase family protein [Planctomycetota bacterium]